MRDEPSAPYRYSRDEAVRLGQIMNWRDSFQNNVKCAKDMCAVIDKHYHDYSLDDGAAAELVVNWGYKRVLWVLANTVQHQTHDGRFGTEIRMLANRIYIPDDAQNNGSFVCVAHPGLVDLLARDVIKIYQGLGMFDYTQCEPVTSELDFQGKVLVLSPETLREDCWDQKNQLWYAHDGFGCAPHARGHSICATCLGDGETARWNRHDFVGVLKEELVPKWAMERLEQLRTPELNQGEMKML